MYPSIQTLTFQTNRLVEELRSINSIEYPTNACDLRDLFLTIANYIEDRLTSTDDPINDEVLAEQFQYLISVSQLIYSYIRYLKATVPGQSPPGVQEALGHLVRQYFPHDRGHPICIVRPQWKYNFKCVPLNWHLNHLINPAVFDPQGDLQADSPDAFLDNIWDISFPDRTRPKQIGILSFAGLDTSDTLFYPLLAHEFGHFIDYSNGPPLPLHLSEPLSRSSNQVKSTIERLLTSNYSRRQISIVLQPQIERTNIAIREILADLIAVRILGFSFFAAQAEWLPMFSKWPQHPLLESGYPGIKLRLAIIFEHLAELNHPGNFQSFLNMHRERGTIAIELIEYMNEWRDILRPFLGGTDLQPDVVDSVERVPEAVINSLIPDLHSVARGTIPDENCIHLTSNFFQRIENLENDLPPSPVNETKNGFAELMSAAWAYQVLRGKQKERTMRCKNARLQEHTKTCRLVMKSIELLSQANT